PVAAALMAKMRIAPEDRPRVKLECLRILATLRLDPARLTLVRTFVDAYLNLNEREMRVYDDELKTIDPPEREAVMQIVNEWEARGMQRASVAIILRLLGRRFGTVPAEMEARLRELPAEKLETLAEDLLDFTALADLEAWLAREA